MITYMPFIPFYDSEKTYEENFEQGPFGAFAQGSGDPKGAGGTDYRGNTSVEPKYDFLGFKVNSPFGIPAGPLLNANFCEGAFEKGFDICVYKTVRSAVFPCHPWPNVLPIKIEGDLTLLKMKQGVVVDKNNKGIPELITNSFGVPSRAPEIWQADVKKAVSHAGLGQIVVLSFMGTVKKNQTEEEFIADYALAARQAMQTGAKILEVNLSCPNIGNEGLVCFNLDITKRVYEEIKKEIGNTPLIAKIAYFSNEVDLKILVEEIGNLVQAISSINTMPAVVLDENGKQTLPGEGRLISGLCGHAIKWAGLEMVRKLKKLREKFDYSFQIIGVGGVTTADDFFEYREAGADIVMSATGAMWNPYLARDVKNRLR